MKVVLKVWKWTEKTFKHTLCHRKWILYHLDLLIIMKYYTENKWVLEWMLCLLLLQANKVLELANVLKSLLCIWGCIKARVSKETIKKTNTISFFSFILYEGMKGRGRHSLNRPNCWSSRSTTLDGKTIVLIQSSNNLILFPCSMKPLIALSNYNWFY